MPEVRLVDEDGEQIGVVATDEALGDGARARPRPGRGRSRDSKPPVARLLDYSKYKYEQEQKAKAARKHQQQVNVREIKLRPKIADHDYETKKGHVERFLRHQDKVKVTIMFRGREQAHPERGRALLDRLFEDVGELAMIEQQPSAGGPQHAHDAAPRGLGAERRRDRPSAREAAPRRPTPGRAGDVRRAAEPRPRHPPSPRRGPSAGLSGRAPCVCFNSRLRCRR